MSNMNQMELNLEDSDFSRHGNILYDIITLFFEYLHPKEQLKFLSLNKRLINYVIFRVSPIQTTLTLYISNFIEDQGMKDRFNQYFIPYCLIPLHNKFSPGEPEPKIYDVETLNRMLLRSIPNNNGDQGRRNEQHFLIDLGATLTHIPDDAFIGMQLTGVTIPETITHIGNNAFNSNQITEVTIPYSVTSIGIGAFTLNRINEITIPDSVTSINSSAFFFQLPRLTIPNVFASNQLNTNSVTHIGSSAFPDRLTEVIIPNPVTHIGNSAFRQNEFDIITSIEDNMFSMNKLTRVTIPARCKDQVTKVKKKKKKKKKRKRKR